MTTESLTEREPKDERAAFCADLHAFANWLAENPWVPLPFTTFAERHLNYIDDKTPFASLTKVREIAALLGVKTDESLPDRTRVTITMGCVEYRLLAWHKNGRPGEPDERDAKIERLTAELAALRAAAALQPDADLSGMGYSREADDPTPVSPARVPLHTGGMVGPVDGGYLVDETGPGLIVGDTADEQRDNAHAAYERDE
jgi:hypothetical protein